MTHDGRSWYFRAEGKRWQFGIGLVPCPFRRPKHGQRWAGDGLDVVLKGAPGFYAEALWPHPTDRRYRSMGWSLPAPASFMPREVQRQLLKSLMQRYERNEIEKRTRVNRKRRRRKPSPTWRTWDG